MVQRAEQRIVFTVGENLVAENSDIASTQQNLPALDVWVQLRVCPNGMRRKAEDLAECVQCPKGVGKTSGVSGVAGSGLGDEVGP